VFKKTIILTAADAISKVLGLLLTPLFLNFMPKEDFGEYSFIIVIVGGLPAFITLGLHISQIKEFSSEIEVTIQRAVFSSTLISVLVVSLLILTIFSITGASEYVMGHFFKIDTNKEMKWLLISLYSVSSCIGLILYSHTIALKNTKILIIFSLVKMILINGISIYLLAIKFNEDSSLSRLLGSTIGDVFFNAIFFFFFCKKYFIFRVDKKYLLKALNLGLPMVPAAFAVLISSSSDRYFINKYFDFTYVAEYSLSVLCVSPLQMIMASAQTILSPTVWAFKNDAEAFQHSTKFLFNFSLLLMPILLIIQAVIYFAKMYNIIPTTYEYINIISLLLSFQTFTFILLQVPFNIFIKHSRTRLVAIISISIAILSLLTGYFITPLLGFTGLIISNTSINLFFLIACFFISKKISFKNEM